MAWTTPTAWAAGDPLTADRLNEEIKDNLLALKDPPSANYDVNEASDYTTTSTSFVNIDGTDLSLTINTNGGDVLVGFHGSFYNANYGFTYLDVEVDGTRHGGNDGIIQIKTHVVGYQLGSFVRLITGLSAGSHTFKLQWKVSTSGSTLYAGAGTSGHDTHPQFWVREVS